MVMFKLVVYVVKLIMFFVNFFKCNSYIIYLIVNNYFIINKNL